MLLNLTSPYLCTDHKAHLQSVWPTIAVNLQPQLGNTGCDFFLDTCLAQLYFFDAPGCSLKRSAAMTNNIRVGAKRSLPANSDESPDSYHTAPIVKRKRPRTSEELNQRARQESRPAVPWTRKHATEVFIPREEVRATQVSFHAIESDGLADKPSKVSVNGYKNLLPKRHSNPRTAQTQNQPALPQSHPTKANSSYLPAVIRNMTISCWIPSPIQIPSGWRGEPSDSADATDSISDTCRTVKT